MLRVRCNLPPPPWQESAISRNCVLQAREGHNTLSLWEVSLFTYAGLGSQCRVTKKSASRGLSRSKDLFKKHGKTKAAHRAKSVDLTAAFFAANTHPKFRHDVPPPARRMALQAQAKHLGVLPRRHRALAHAQRHRAQQTALRSLCLEVHSHTLRSDRRRVPQLLLQTHVLPRRSGRDIQASEGSRSCAGDD